MTPTFRRDATLAALVILAVSAIVSFAPPPDASRFNGQAHDFGHVLVFGVLGLALARSLRGLAAPLGRWTSVTVLTLLVGGIAGIGTEYVQKLSGSVLSWGDVGRDLLGTAIGICAAIALDAGTTSRLRRLLWLAVALGLVAAAIPLTDAVLDYRARAARFPAILDPSAPRGLVFVTSFGERVATGPLPAGLADGGTLDVGERERRARAARERGVDPATLPPALLDPADPRARVATNRDGHAAIVIKPERGPWPGLTLEEPAPDWRGFRALVVDLANPTDAPLTLWFRVNDEAHDNRYEDRYDTWLELPPRTRRRFAFPVADMQAAPDDREMRMDQIEKVIVFHSGPAPGKRFYVLGMTLVR